MLMIYMNFCFGYKMSIDGAVMVKFKIDIYVLVSVNFHLTMTTLRVGKILCTNVVALA